MNEGIRTFMEQLFDVTVDSRGRTERAAFEAWADKHWGNSAHLHKSATSGEWDAWQAGRVDLPVLLAQVDSLRTVLVRLLDGQNKETKLQARTLLLTLKRFEVEL
jgi:hypothetical protein